MTVNREFNWILCFLSGVFVFFTFLFAWLFISEIRCSLFAALVSYSKVLVNLSTSNPLFLAFGWRYLVDRKTGQRCCFMSASALPKLAWLQPHCVCSGYVQKQDCFYFIFVLFLKFLIYQILKNKQYIMPSIINTGSHCQEYVLKYLHIHYIWSFYSV